MSTPSDSFKHSVPVPRIYKIASKIAKSVKEGRDSLKNLVYQQKHVNIKTVYALVVETFKRDEIIVELVKNSELLVNEPRFDPWLAKILICELLWGKNKMKGDSKPVCTILEYEKKLRELLSNQSDIPKNLLNHNVAKPRYVRVNTIKITMEEAVDNFRDEGWTLVPFLDKSNYKGFIDRLNKLESDEFMPDIHVPNLLLFPPKTEFFRHEAYKTKHIILQDKASCLPVHLLGADPGSTVLDMCAAPGMKTTQLAASLNNSGKVYAIELDKNREKLLRELVEEAGATCVETRLKDAMQVTEDDCPNVQYILVDPSCSGSGITDRVEVDNEDIAIKAMRLRKLCGFQAKLLRYALTSFPQARRVVYSTCSINPEENEDVVRQVLETVTNFKLIDAKKLLKSWNNLSSNVVPELGDMCVYATPENDKTNGFFIAVFERLEEGEKNPYLNVQLVKMFEKGPRISKDQNGNLEGKQYDKKKNGKRKSERHEEYIEEKPEEYEQNYNKSPSGKKLKRRDIVAHGINSEETTYTEDFFESENCSNELQVKNHKKKKQNQETEPTEEFEQQNTNFKRKNKKSKKELISDVTSICDGFGETKKKAKSKFEENEGESSKIDENITRKKKRKIKDVLHEESNIDISNEEQIPAKTKKKKKKLENVEIPEETEISTKTKKKKKKFEDNEVSEEAETDIHLQEQFPAKAKKKKFMDVEAGIDNIREQIPTETKKKKKSSHTGDL